MMKFCTAVVEPFADIDILVSLNTIMVDGTGMCGGCRVRIGNEIRFVCVDGPEFDGRLVDWDSMLKRLQAYRPITQLITNHSTLGSVANPFSRSSSVGMKSFILPSWYA